MSKAGVSRWKKPAVSTKEPNTSAKEPYTSAIEPYIPAEELNAFVWLTSIVSHTAQGAYTAQQAS